MLWAAKLWQLWSLFTNKDITSVLIYDRVKSQVVNFGGGTNWYDCCTYAIIMYYFMFVGSPASWAHHQWDTWDTYVVNFLWWHCIVRCGETSLMAVHYLMWSTMRIIVREVIEFRVLRLLQWSSWGFHSSGMWFSVTSFLDHVFQSNVLSLSSKASKSWELSLLILKMTHWEPLTPGAV